MPETSPPPAAAPSDLGACKLLRGLAPDDLERVAARLERIEVAEGSVLLREGDRSQDLYFLLAGTARLRRHQMSLRAIGPGDHFGALALFTGRPRTTWRGSRRPPGRRSRPPTRASPCTCCAPCSPRSATTWWR
jgi:CRP-like cAMP-binding protein